jgi:hypothetical protein
MEITVVQQQQLEPKTVKNFGPLSAFGNLNWFSTRSESVLQLATFKSYNFGYISVQFGNLVPLTLSLLVVLSHSRL